jgi:Tol biopolymer transport system component
VIDQQNVERAAERFRLPEGSFERLTLRRDRRHRNQRIRAGVLGVTIAVAVGWLGINAIRSTDPVPGDDGVSNVLPPEGIFSEVGGWIAFQGDGALRAIAPDGSEETVLVDERDLEAQDWSPDGSRLLVVRYSGSESLSVIEPDGSETTLVRFDEYAWFSGASFSPDGATVVYTTWPMSGDMFDDAPSQMWTVASDGSEEPRLVLESDQSLGLSDELGYTLLYEPTYSPDGTRIAYIDGWYDHSHSLRVVNADGTDVRVLFDATTPPFGAGHVRGVEWSPDGSLIAIAGGPEGDGSGIYTVRPDGTDLHLLIPEAASPAWSPDGSLIAYSPEDVEHSLGWGVWVANADGSNPRMISAIGQVGPWNPGGPADEQRPT